MFFDAFNNCFSKLKIYNTSKLYLAAIGIVFSKDGGYICSNEVLKFKFIIVEKGKKTCWISDNYVKSIINKNKYLYFHKQILLDNVIGEVLVYNLIPLSDYVKEDVISFNDIEEIELKINGFKKQEILPEPKEKLEDVCLKEFLRLADIAKLISNEEHKNIIVNEINGLATSYVQEKINLASNGELNLTLNNEFILTQKYMKEIYNIEEKIKKEVLTNNLYQELNYVKLRSLKNDRK